MGNKVTQKCSFNLRESSDLDQFLLSINVLDGFYMDTTLSTSSKCLVILNNLINNADDNIIKLMSGLEIEKDDNLVMKIDRLKFHFGLIRHLAVMNSGMETVEELVELNNVQHLISLTLDHVPIRFVQHLKQHRETLLKLSVHFSLDSLKSVIELCGGDHSFPHNWSNLLHLDVRYNRLRNLDDSVLLLTSLTVLDISRNDLDDISFIKKIPTVKCLNASFNCIRYLPYVSSHDLQVLILGYNYLDRLEGIQGFKKLSTLNVSYNAIATKDHLLPIKEMDCLKDLILSGNPLCYSNNYRKGVLDIVSRRVSIDFAIDGKCLTKKESLYFHKRPIVVIAPPFSSPREVFNNVPIIVTERNNVTSDAPSSVPQSYAKRTLYHPRIQNELDQTSNRDENDYVETLPRKHSIEKKIESVSASGTDFDTVFTAPMIHKLDSRISEMSYMATPYYVGKKCSNLFILCFNNVRNSFINVSMQIIEHKLMAVNESNVIVDSVDLWKLLVVSCETLQQGSDADKILKLVFIDPSIRENVDGIILCTRTIEFTDIEQLNIFLDQLTVYLNGFSVSYESKSVVPLSNILLSCQKCFSSIKSNNDLIRPYKCLICSGTSFILQFILSKSIERDAPINSPVIQTPVIRNIQTGYKKGKSSTSNLVIRAFASKDSLQRHSDDKSSMQSDNDTCKASSYHTALDDSNLDQSIIVPSHSQDVDVGRSSDSLRSGDRFDDEDEEEDNKLMQFDLDCALNVTSFQLEKSIVPHEVEEDNAVYAMLKSALKAQWIIHEPSCDINIHMHNRKIDDRVKLYFLTKVMQGQEDLIGVFKVYLVFKSTNCSTNALVVISDLRLIIFNILDKVSNNIEECIKLVSEFPLKTLQQIEYCLNYQWIDLQFKSKPAVTFLVGDIDSIKNIGVTIGDVSSGMSSNINVIFSKTLTEVTNSQLLSILTSKLNDESTMGSLVNSESYLIKTSTIFPIEKSSLEYAPKMILIEAEHIFFMTITYTPKNNQPTFHLLRTISLYALMNEIIVDSFDDCSLRLIVFENGEKTFLDLNFISSHSRSKAAMCIGRMWKELFKMDILYSLEDLIHAQ